MNVSEAPPKSSLDNSSDSRALGDFVPSMPRTRLLGTLARGQPPSNSTRKPGDDVAGSVDV